MVPGAKRTAQSRASIVVSTHWIAIDELSASDRHELWALKLANINHAAFGAEAQRLEAERFGRALSGYTHVSVGRSSAGELVYFSLFALEHAVGGDPREHLLAVGAQYKRPGYRPRAPFMGPMRALAFKMARSPLSSRVVVISDVSIAGFARLLRALSPVAPLWLHGEPGMPPRVARALTRVSRSSPDADVRWDPSRGVLHYPAPLMVSPENLIRSGLSLVDFRRFIARVRDPFGDESNLTVPVGAEVGFPNGMRLVVAALRERFLWVGQGTPALTVAAMEAVLGRPLGAPERGPGASDEESSGL